ncbi:peptide/nickel transport system substrate-binding protein [Bartonella silvatica]|uniref:Peptide/nickel transport system substrate-binding protein n=1 Tax=Bartonella silvatica TaxID=357760 RepID=A0ABV2HII0_9HYPH
MNFKRKLLRGGSSFITAFIVMGMFPQQVSAKTPANTLVMAWNLDGISTFDPAQINDVYAGEIILNVCDNLVDSVPNDATKFVPRLAKSWDVTSDDHGTTITFHLRDDLKFNDGRSANANDLVWSMKRVVKLKLGNASTLNEYGITEQTVDDVIQAPDEKTMVMKFAKPYPTTLLLDNIASRYAAALLDRKTLMKHEKNGDMGNHYLAAHSACVGPYQIKSWNPGKGLMLRASSHYWGDKPKLKQILISHVSEPSTQRLMLEKHDIDVARDLPSEALETLQKTTDIRVEKILPPLMMYWGFNMTNPIFSHAKVRLAMRYLIDYDGLGKTLLKNVAIPRASFLPLGTLGALDEKEGQPFKLDLKKAKQLLTEAGYPDGFEAKILVSAAPLGETLAQSIQDNAEKVGVHLKIERLAGAQLFDKVYARAFDTVVMGWNSDSSDPQTMASRIIYNPDNRFEAKNTAYPSWHQGYFDENMNRLVEDALFEKDPKKRVEKYGNLQRKLMQEGPYAFIYQKYQTVALSPSVKKWVWNSAPRIFYNLIEK